jgi:hypothetical protein
MIRRDEKKKKKGESVGREEFHDYDKILLENDINKE